MLYIDGVLMFGVFGCLGVFLFSGARLWCGGLVWFIVFRGFVRVLGVLGLGLVVVCGLLVCWFEFLGLTFRGCCGLLVSDVVV